MSLDDYQYTSVCEELMEDIPADEPALRLLMRQCGANSVEELFEQLMLFYHCEDCNKADCTVLDCAPMQEIRRHNCGYDYMDDECECTILAFMNYPCFYYYASIANHFEEGECDVFPCPLCHRLEALIAEVKDPLVDSQGWRREFMTKSRVAMIVNVTYAVRMELNDNPLNILTDIRRHERRIYEGVISKDEYLNHMERLLVVYTSASIQRKAVEEMR